MSDKGHDGTLPAGGGILAREDGSSIAYNRVQGKGPGIVFVHGFHSDMEGTKALVLERMCQARGLAFVRFDLFGHGKSSGTVEDGCVSRWADDVLAVVDTLTTGPQVLVGSSLGGWLALLAALQRPSRVAALVGIAAAPDFTEDLMWAEFTPDQRRDLIEKGFVTLENCYEPENPWKVPRLLIEDGRNNLLLVDTINLACPIRLIQGQKDEDVPWRTALKIADRVVSEDVEVVLVKDGGHRLSRDQDLARIVALVEGVVAAIETPAAPPVSP
jgi:pimeloyl-ACP methyl ester carboxylesterase